ncbi:MAG: glycerate kinase [Planctomycetales bacterium]|nr:glycerate kinase [Planctomycetales bacterium]
MNVLVIPDKFKGSLSASEVIHAIQAGLRKHDPEIQIHAITASDGGDGFLDAIRKSNDAVQTIRCETTDPLGRTIMAEYGIDRHRKSAYIEMARASGMELLRQSERNPMLTTTLGTGLLLVDAIDRDLENIYIGLGGSATNDGGIGIAHALGFRFLDSKGGELQPIGGSLEQIDSIDVSGVTMTMKNVKVHAINDVTNPLTGPEGAATVYAPQKGADAEMVVLLERGLDRLQQVVCRDLGVDAAHVPGAGAAGGTGYGLKVFLGAEFLSGIEFVLSLTGIESLLESGNVDWIISGEGKIDDQTGYGKLVCGVANIGKKYGVPVIALCGVNALQHKTVADLGLAKVVSIHDPTRPLEYTIHNAKELLTKAAEHVFI